MKKSLTVFLALSLLCPSVHAGPAALRVFFGSGAAGLLVFPYVYVNMRKEVGEASSWQLPSDPMPIDKTTGLGVLEGIKARLSRAPAPVSEDVKVVDVEALVGVRDALDRFGLQGKIKVIGSPPFATNVVAGVSLWQQYLCVDLDKYRAQDREERGFGLVRAIRHLQQRETELVTLAAPAVCAAALTSRPKIPQGNFRFLGKMLFRTPAAVVGCLAFSVPMRWALDLDADRAAVKAIGADGCVRQIEAIRARNLSKPPGWDVFPITGDYIPGLLFSPPIALRLWQMRRLARQQAEQGGAGSSK